LISISAMTIHSQKFLSNEVFDSTHLLPKLIHAAGGIEFSLLADRLCFTRKRAHTALELVLVKRSAISR